MHCDIDVNPDDGKMLGEDPDDIISEDTPLLGVLHQEINFDRAGTDRSGHSLRGRGNEAGAFRFTTNPGVSEEAPDGDEASDRLDALPAVTGSRPHRDGTLTGAHDGDLLAADPPDDPQSLDDRGNVVEKGSVLVFPDVTLRWDGQGNIIQDVFITLTNDYNLSPDVRVKMYFVNGDAPLTP
jgi:hypothetical protein